MSEAIMTPPDTGTTAHTPGPWRAFKHGLVANKNVEWLVEQDRLGGRLVAISNTGEQDAHLIAAAPAMYEALKAFIDAEDALIAELRAEGKFPDLTEKPWTLTDAMRAALRLAQGDGSEGHG